MLVVLDVRRTVPLVHMGHGASNGRIFEFSEVFVSRRRRPGLGPPKAAAINATQATMRMRVSSVPTLRTLAIVLLAMFICLGSSHASTTTPGATAPGETTKAVDPDDIGDSPVVVQKCDSSDRKYRYPSLTGVQ
jgi:hypothetical protein